MKQKRKKKSWYEWRIVDGTNAWCIAYPTKAQAAGVLKRALGRPRIFKNTRWAVAKVRKVKVEEV